MNKNNTVLNLLPESVKSVLGEDSCKAIQEAFDNAVEKRVNERLEVAVRGAEANFDTIMNERLEKLISKMEGANKVGLKRVYDKLNERTAAMASRYQARLNEAKKEIHSLRADKVRGKKALNKALGMIGESKESARLTSRESNRKSVALGRFLNEAKQGVARVSRHYQKQLRDTERHGVRALVALKEHYENKVAADTKKFKKQLVESISDYVDGAIDRKMPYGEIKKVVRNRAAMKLVESLKAMLNVDALSTLETIKAPINEAKQMIASAKRQNKRLVKESVLAKKTAARRENALRKQLNEAKAIVAKKDEEKRNLIANAKKQINEAKRIAYLNEKLATIPSKEQREYVKRVMANQPVEFIKENFDYTLKKHRESLLRENDILAERAKAVRKSKAIPEVSRRRLAAINEAARPVAAPAASGVDMVIDQIASDMMDD